MNIAHLLDKQAIERPAATAIIEGSATDDGSITFAELKARSASLAARLTQDGVRPDDHVLVFVPMSIDLYVVLVALFRAGAVATFVDPSAGRAHLEHCCEIARPAAFIATAKAHLFRFVSQGLRRIRRKYRTGSLPVPGAISVARVCRNATSNSVVVDRVAHDGALLTFTSGSTGVPKAAVRTHGFLTAQHAALVESLKLKPDTVDLATLPIFALANLATGATTVIPNADLRRPGAINPTNVLAQLARYRPTSCVASPAFYERLLAGPPNTRQSLQCLKRSYTGGAPVLPNLLKRIAELTGGEAIAVYGSTEAEPIAHVAWSEMSQEDVAATAAGKGLVAGPPVPQAKTRIINTVWGQPLGPMPVSEFDLLEVPINVPGEIVVTGDHVLRGYLHGRGDEQTKIRVGDDGTVWHRTGDVGYFDTAGRIWLLGRAEAVIHDDRGTLYAFAVECAAMQVAGVRRAALLAVNGQRALLLEPANPRQDSTLDTIVGDAVAWARLDTVRVVRHIPLDKRHNAKIDYVTLRRRIHRIAPGL